MAGGGATDPAFAALSTEAARLERFVTNLLDNAGKFGAPGTPIGVVAIRSPDALTLRVLDEGPGLPPGFEGQAFDRFARIEGSDRAREGTGPGLAIVKGSPRRWASPSPPPTAPTKEVRRSR